MINRIPLFDEIESCQICAPDLPLGARPIVRGTRDARILIIGQAPGRKVHETGIAWNDASGKRLRQWMGVDEATFYNESLIAIVPMGFCYPGKGPSGDMPPRPECAPAWHEKVLRELSSVRLTMLVGQYAQKYYLREAFVNLTDTVRCWDRYFPKFFPLPHPSPRNQHWLKKNPWFEASTLPVLQASISNALQT